MHDGPALKPWDSWDGQGRVVLYEQRSMQPVQVENDGKAHAPPESRFTQPS